MFSTASTYLKSFWEVAGQLPGLYGGIEDEKPKIDLDSTVTKVAREALSGQTSKAKTYTDPSGLVTPVRPDTKPSHPKLYEWELNFALLCSAYQRTDNKETKETIRFLMTNYLQKAAYLNAATRSPLQEAYMQAYENMLQLGQLTLGGQYHRGAFRENSTADLLELVNRIGSSNETSMDIIALDTIEIQDLYKLGFIVAPDLSKPDEIVDILVEQFEKNLAQFPNEHFQFPILIDITQQMDQSLITDKDPDKIRKYEEKTEEAKLALKQIFKQASDRIKVKYSNRADIQTNVHDYLIINTAIVSRAEVTNRAGILFLNLIYDDLGFEHEKWLGKFSAMNARGDLIREKVQGFVAHTGTALGAINFRKAAAELFTDVSSIANLGEGKMVDYAPPGKTDVVLYDKPGKILESQLFSTLMKMADGKFENVGPAQTLLVKATVQMMITLLCEIPEEMWTAKQSDPIIRELTQNAMFRLSQHLATAITFRGDFRKFSQAIDRAHAEMTVLLTLYKPFEAGTFEKQYRAFIQPLLPKSMEPTTVGLAKSAMNIFAGVNAAVMQNSPSAVRICGAHSYYEEMELVGETKTLDQALEDPNIEKIDLYVGEFHHNIDIDAKHNHYQKGTIAADIRAIFAKKPKTDALTVAIDATIDFTRSEDLKALFKEFEKEIKEGRLNIVVFRSGQKFDMLGLDNYYGAPFYIVNNGDKKWESFNKIKTDKVFQTDELSHQFFAWMAETGFEIVDEYKQLLFENTRRILEVVPERLKPQSGREISISSFENGVLSPFFEITIDIKPTAQMKKPQEDTEWERDVMRRKLQEVALKTFIDHERLIFERGSFGFHHPNITWIDPKFRINPGLDPSDLPLYEEFFQKADAILLEYEKSHP